MSFLIDNTVSKQIFNYSHLTALLNFTSLKKNIQSEKFQVPSEKNCGLISQVW